jgi:VWFA-related protein
MRRRSITALFSLTLASAALLIIPVHSAAASPSQDQAIHVGVPLVNVYATVLDKKNALVPNLEQTDFKIFEDKVEQKISFFSREDTLPLSIGVILDTSTSEKHNLETEQKSASEFLHRSLRPGDRAFVVAFDVGANLLANWTSDLGTLDRGIQRALIGIGYNNNVKDGQFVPAGSHLWDVIYASCLNKMASETGRKTLIVITDSHDEGSDKSVVDAIEAAQRSDTLIQMLIVETGATNYSPDVAKRIATETGGSAINITSQFRLQNAFDKISDELRTEYALGYYPTNAKADGKFRHLKVEMTNKDYKALAREGYFARAAVK